MDIVVATVVVGEVVGDVVGDAGDAADVSTRILIKNVR